MLDQCEFGAWVQLSKVYLIHEGSNQKDASTRAPKNVFRRQRVGNRIRVKSRSLIRYSDNKRVGRRFKRRSYMFVLIVRISVQYGIYRSFAHRHGDVRNGVFIKSRSLGTLLGSLLNLVDAIQ